MSKQDPAVRAVAARINENPLAKGAAGGQTRPYSDPQNQTAAHLHGFNQTTRIVIGVITDCVAIAHCYRVQLEKGHAPIVASLTTSTAFSAVGPRQIGTLQPGTQVLVAMHPQLGHGFILCALPLYQTAANRGLGDQITQASRTRVDDAHKLPLRLPANGGIVDWSGSRPIDGLTAGEQGWMTPTGLRITIDDFLVQLGVSEACGVFAFYHDDLLRLAGVNLQVWTSGSEREAFNDEGLYHDYTGYTPYPWEQLGILDAQGQPWLDRGPEETQVKQPWYSKREPASDHAQPFHRVQHFQGYLGQGGRVVNAAPPPGMSTFAYDDSPSSNPTPLIGLHEDNVLLDGRRCIRSAKGISLAKDPSIVVPRRRLRPEDGRGDTAETYQFEQHQITGDLATSGEHPSLQRAAGVLDLHAYISNYAGLHPFHYHTKDWDTPEAAALPIGKAPAPTFSSLSSNMSLDPPEAKQITVDTRYGKQNYYPNRSYFDMLEDGTVVHGDGFGAEIRMGGGHIMLTAPGDIWIKSGRNLHHWAGNDSTTRAKNCIDVSATNGSLRFKAEKDLLAVAGNGGAGGILLESRGAGDTYDFETPGEGIQFGGVLIRAPKGQVVTHAADVYLRTGGGAVAHGDITLDAGQGEGSIVTRSRSFTQLIQDRALQIFESSGNVSLVNEFSRQSCTIGTPLSVLGSASIVGHVLTRGNLMIASGHIATEQAEGLQFKVNPLKDLALRSVNDSLDQTQTRAQTDLRTDGRDSYRNLKEKFYDTQRAGSDAAMTNAQFSFRSTAEYKSELFYLYEDRWQQIARLNGEQLSVWVEKPVACEKDPETFPFPGRENFQSPKFHQQDLNLVSIEEGGYVDRGSDGNTAEAYANPKYAPPSPPTSLQTYPVVM